MGNKRSEGRYWAEEFREDLLERWTREDISITDYPLPTDLESRYQNSSYHHDEFPSYEHVNGGRVCVFFLGKCGVEICISPNETGAYSNIDATWESFDSWASAIARLRTLEQSFQVSE
jgi:hypothetical protein